MFFFCIPFLLIQSKTNSFLKDETVPSAIAETSSTTDCPYCDFKTNNIEDFKIHVISHIRDKNYRCLLCNRLYKYRGRINCVFSFFHRRSFFSNQNHR